MCAYSIVFRLRCTKTDNHLRITYIPMSNLFMAMFAMPGCCVKSYPYTGGLAIFASRYLNGQPALILEDGYQQRACVSVYDVVQACCLALDVSDAAGHVLNIGSGHAATIRMV